ncbi:hypothetical protein PHJA_001641100 [Phtheirospermum japonicum]|uniref:Uncharacterized protein n=1 Tax=Phtheirospermum japonicum TaxID=374723 RepID=A0A830C2R9_9LAMI|nr:hypothetical protein PHJA_001641100 [Phtheirospermum japonicum]
MACYVEEEVWKCPKHPSKRRRNGICPVCLRDRLVGLCPHCANVRPCACVVSTSSSSSSSSSFSRVIDGEPSFHRSRSVAIPFLRSRNSEQAASKTPSFLSILKMSKTKRCDQAAERGEGFVDEINFESHNRIEDFARMITRSRSVSVGTTAMTSGFRRSKDNSSPAKGKFWHFPSPMTVFRSSKTPKVIVQDRSPLHRG